MASDNQTPVPGSVGGQSVLARWIDHAESYGPAVMAEFARALPPTITSIVDLGAGSGRDLGIFKAAHPQARTIAIEAGQDYVEGIAAKVDEVHCLDIERDPLPFADDSIDVVIANQVLEHTKEVFWIFHEVTRVLKPGGVFVFGVPNLASLHNRALLLLGRHPTQHKLYSAHVRPFSKTDTVRFLDVCFPGGYELQAFRGSQFYPLPPAASRVAARLLPSMAFSIFFMIRKKRHYDREFLDFPVRARLETNFWLGGTDASQYGRE